MYYTTCDSPIGILTLAATEDALTGLWLEGQKYFASTIKEEMIQRDDLLILKTARYWLERYFAGDRPSITDLKLAPSGSGFRQKIWRILCDIPYGKTVTYGEIAKEIARIQGRSSMSAQAVGGAVGHNPISIIIPCHRVIGSDGKLTGYAGGIDKKKWLLVHETEGCLENLF